MQTEAAHRWASVVETPPGAGRHDGEAARLATLAQVRRVDRVLTQWDERDLAQLGAAAPAGIAALERLRQALIERLRSRGQGAA